MRLYCFVGDLEPEHFLHEGFDAAHLVYLSVEQEEVLFEGVFQQLGLIEAEKGESDCEDDGPPFVEVDLEDAVEEFLAEH